MQKVNKRMIYCLVIISTLLYSLLSFSLITEMFSISEIKTVDNCNNTNFLYVISISIIFNTVMNHKHLLLLGI